MSVVKYEDALRLSTEYFNGDELAAQVFIGKYALRNNNGDILESTPHEMHNRLAREFARVEAKYPNPMTEDEIFNLLSGFRYVVPQGSPMSAIGNPYKLQSLSNCFVIENPRDSYGGILYTDQEQAQIMKRRGGVGFDISTIRPRGLPTANAAGTTDGIGVFMERFSNTCREVAQGGRRGALMLTVSCLHPEIETFIDIKRDLKKVTGANISIRLTDSFMKAVEANDKFTLQWPVDVPIEKATVTREVDAKMIWDKIIDAAWSSAEPGLLFWDTVKRETPADLYSDKGFGSVSTNPCIVGSTLIATADGRNAVSIKKLAEEGKDVPVYSTNPETGQIEIKFGRNPRLTKKNVEVWKLTLDDGSFLIATPDHRIMLKDCSYVELQNLKAGDSIFPFYSFNSNGYRQICDFAHHPSESNGKYSGYANDQLLEHGRKIFQKHGKITSSMWIEYAKANNLPQVVSNDFRFKTWKNFANQVSENHKVVSVEKYGTEDVYNITVDDNHNYHVITSHEDPQFVVSSGICVKNCGEIVLSPYDSCRLLLMNLTGYVKNAFTPSAYFDYELFGAHVKKAQRLMDDLVDLELEAVDKIIEKISTDPEPNKVKEIELNLWKRIREVGAAGRRTGLGITALGDTLAGINQTYGSDESIATTEKIYKTLAVHAHESSVQMAGERGPFSAWEKGRHKGHPFFDRLLAESSEMTNVMFEKHGRRNICLTTTAPAGSVSMLTQTTSGIEPAFLLSYKRRKKINPNDMNSRVDFVDQLGDKWQEFTVYHHWYRKWMDANGHKETTPELEKSSPYGGATSNDIDWVASVKLQAAAQKWVEHSLSKTCNLPNNVTRETVANVYMEAWKAGCKGFTVYRDGCRTGVLVSSEESKKEKESGSLTENHAPKRPKDLPAEIHRVNVRSGDVNESYVVIVGLLQGKPYEIFCGLSQYVEVPKKVKTGTLVKNGKKEGVSTYNLVIPVGDDDQMTFKDVVTLFDNPTNGAFTRTISLALRHGVPIQYMVEQLQKDKHSDMQSFSRVIARVLKGYIPDGTKSGDRDCASCGAKDSLAYQEGCVSCKSCGFSKCS